MPSYLADASHIFLYTVAAMLPVTNPVGLSAPFYIMTSHMERTERKALAWRVAANYFFLVMGTLVLGVLVLEIFGISVGVVDVAGGLVLFHAAWKMLEGEHEYGGGPEAKTADDIHFFPLTMPLTADAAVLAIAISLSGSLHHHWDFHTVVEYGSAIAAIGLVALSVGICYGSSHHTIGRLGRTGAQILTKISAFILMAVGVEIIVTGITEIVADVAHGEE
ncbi:MAG: MarC family protein [Gammaproteobacteria bacterium]|nr:MarC family protein [Gammaproteobacteria bacterium]MDE0273968.1 MarC family protein [Gammaproteobacteria bacterium]